MPRWARFPTAPVTRSWRTPGSSRCSCGWSWRDGTWPASRPRTHRDGPEDQQPDLTRSSSASIAFVASSVLVPFVREPVFPRFDRREVSPDLGLRPRLRRRAISGRHRPEVPADRGERAGEAGFVVGDPTSFAECAHDRAHRAVTVMGDAGEQVMLDLRVESAVIEV